MKHLPLLTLLLFISSFVTKAQTDSSTYVLNSHLKDDNLYIKNRKLIYHGVEYVKLSAQKKLIQSFNQPDVNKKFKRYLLLMRISNIFAFVGSEAIAASIANASNLVGKKQRDEVNVTISVSGIGALGLSYFFYRQAEKKLQKVANSVTSTL